MRNDDWMSAEGAGTMSGIRDIEEIEKQQEMHGSVVH